MVAAGYNRVGRGRAEPTRDILVEGHERMDAGRLESSILERAREPTPGPPPGTDPDARSDWQ